ncbi:MAG: 50S ribosomal protein L1 [candidate division CPR3 bacterium GW2011_GWE2_35_7]|uniref:Ribosomal protein n=1 Tax=candidate division CPR3 bacterium GW2011_GWF2_35_18 TaxID=1618350 RepID=A0A0G0EQ50_UNCC3|nr:MAG: 50S ribosomal protein L1 [candidate division CPR3 bacterium GW2011_GWF2_35_18]KKP86530.1 MAG: 50S ribosomal protein L1 [candidate division CPR3 bacterium GW2011_GWE2_35_7]
MGKKEIKDLENMNSEELKEKEVVKEKNQKSKSKPETKSNPKIRGKKYQNKLKQIENRKYSLSEALKLLKEISYTKFDPKVELHINLSIDPKKSDQIIRKVTSIPFGIKKELKILVFGDQDQIKEAKESGATYVSDEETITKVKNGWTGFDKVLATPEMMPKIALLAKILGPKGLMPNIKNNTVTKNIKETISNLISGNSLEIKNEKDFPIVHTIIGPLSFGEEKLKGNFKSIYETIIVARPPKVKNPYIKSITIKTTMSPSIKLDPDKLN